MAILQTKENPQNSSEGRDELDILADMQEVDGRHRSHREAVLMLFKDKSDDEITIYIKIHIANL